MSHEEHIESMLPAPRSRWASSLAFGLIIFACGIAAGVAMGLRWNDYNERRTVLAGEQQTYAERMTAHLTEDLDLSPEQAEKVFAILTRHTEQFREIHAAISPKLKIQMDCLREEVGDCLDERQRALWEEKVKRLRKRTQSHI